MGEGEEHGCERDGRSAAHSEAEEAQQDVNLQNELLHQRPKRVAENVNDNRQRAVERVQGVQVFCQRDPGEKDGDCGGDDPEGGQQATQAEAVGLVFLAAQDCGDRDPREGGPVEDALGRVRRPDDDEDQAVADTKLGQIANAGRQPHDVRLDERGNAAVIAAAFRFPARLWPLLAE